MKILTPENTYSSDTIVGIIGKEEFLQAYDNNEIPFTGTVLIAIHEPKAQEHSKSITDKFNDSIQMNFWDVEEDFGHYKGISITQGAYLADFIIKNRDKRFLIHCVAGQSRSAAIGMAIECIVNYNGCVYDFYRDEPKIFLYKRYDPNLNVFYRVIESIMFPIPELDEPNTFLSSILKLF